MSTQVYLCPTFGVGYQAFTSGGLPLNAGLINTYIAGGTTPQATYTESTGTTANANPIVLNADGRTPAEVWLLAGQAYRFDVTDSLGNLLGSYDNITGVNDPAVASPSGLLTSVAGTNTITATASPVPTAYTSGTKYTLVPANTNTGATTLNVAGLGAKNIFAGGAALVGGELVVSVPVLIEYDGTQFNIVNGAPFVDTRPLIIGSVDATKKLRFEVDTNLTTGVTRIATVPNSDFNMGAPRSYLAGLTMSTAGSSATMAIAAGVARDSTNVADIALASSISKTTSAWSVGTGNGGLDTGSIANSTWYHFYVIIRPDTGVTDVLFSTSASSPTLPSNYTLFRRIGSGKTNGSAQWTLFTQDGDLFIWAAYVADVNANNPGTSAVSRTLTVPTGINVMSIANWILTTSGTGSNGLISDLNIADVGASTTNMNVGVGITNSNGGTQLTIRTNTSAQVRSRVSASDANVTLNCATIGWIDRRGRDS